MAKGFINPYNPVKSSDQFGITRGSGIPGQYGKRKGTFTGEVPNKPKEQTPPKKF